MATKISNITELEQGRAKYAFECAKKGSEIEKNKEYKAYKAYVKKIPMLIKTNGLGATIAFIYSKANDDEGRAGYAYKMIYTQIDDWLKTGSKRYLLQNADQSTDDLAYKIVSLSSAEYRAVTCEVISLFMWMRRFADALIEGDAGNAE